jgi:putative membrane protein
MVIVLTAAGMFFGLNGPALAQQANGAVGKMASKKQPAVPASNFTDKASEISLLEVELGKVAMNKSADAQVKRFAMRMVDDHSKAGDDLKGIGAKDDFDVPDQVDANDQLIIDRLSKLSGEAFDKAYMRQMVMDHENAVMLFEHEAGDGGSPDVKTWAAGVLLTLQDHLREAREIENRLVGGSL